MQIIGILLFMVVITGIPFLAGMFAATAMGTVGAVAAFGCCVGFQLFFGYLIENN